MAEQTVPMVGPDGSTADVPNGNVPDAVKAGARIAVRMRGTDGTHAYVPLDQVHDAMQAGAVLPGNAADDKGMLGTIWSNVKDMAAHPWETTKGAAKGAVKAVQDFMPGMQGSETFEQPENKKYDTVKKTINLLNADKLLTPNNETQRSGAAAAESVLPISAALEGTLGLAKNIDFLREGVQKGLDSVNQTAATIKDSMPSAARLKTVSGTTLKTAGKVADVVGDTLSNEDLSGDIAGTISPRASKLGKLIVRAGSKLGKWGELLSKAPPELTSESRTLPGANPPEVIQPAGTPPATAQPIPQREGLALPPAPAGAELSELPATGAKPAAQSGEALANAPITPKLEAPGSVVEAPQPKPLPVRNPKTGRMEPANAPLLRQASALRGPVNQAIDAAVPPTGATKAQNLKVKDQVNFYLKKGDAKNIAKTLADAKIAPPTSDVPDDLTEKVKYFYNQVVAEEAAKKGTVTSPPDLTDALTSSLQRIQAK